MSTNKLVFDFELKIRPQYLDENDPQLKISRNF